MDKKKVFIYGVLLLCILIVHSYQFSSITKTVITIGAIAIFVYFFFKSDYSLEALDQENQERQLRFGIKKGSIRLEYRVSTSQDTIKYKNIKDMERTFHKKRTLSSNDPRLNGQPVFKELKGPTIAEFNSTTLTIGYEKKKTGKGIITKLLRHSQ